jgi:hypothetical protein
MRGCPPDQESLQRFISEIGRLPPRPHHTALLAAARDLAPNCNFQFALTRAGWYRPGGVIRPDGTRLNEDLEAWAEAELEGCGGDIAELVERHGEDGLLATRLSGRTHYFAGAFGPNPAEFMQLEVEELQEVLDRALIDPANPPADLQELTDPMTPLSVAAQPVGHPRYRFRRLIDMRQVLARQPAPIGGLSPLGRFMAEWVAGSAADRDAFCDHWIVAVREHQDRYRNTVLSANPVSVHTRELKPFHWDTAQSGVDFGNQIHAFDRAAGYPGAWYFHLVAAALVPRGVAYAVRRELEAGFSYLGDKEQALLERWLGEPYAA